MTVPVVGSLTRKPPWRYLPEIHSSRLSFSGSMRPKMGLMILCTLLCLSVIALLVPLITKLYQSQANSDLLYSDSPHGDSLLTEYALHMWKGGSEASPPSLIFSPNGISHLVSVLSVLSSSQLHPQYETSHPHKSINNTVEFHVSGKHLYDDIMTKLGPLDGDQLSSGVHIKLVNKTTAMVETDMLKDAMVGMEKEDGAGVSILSSHQVNLVFPNIKLTEEKYFMSPDSSGGGVTKKIVMYDIVGPVSIQDMHGRRVVTIQDLNGLVFTIILSKGRRGDRVDEVLRNIQQFLVKPEQRFLVKKFVRLRIPIISTEGVTQLGDILRHLHSNTNLNSPARGGEGHPKQFINLAVPGPRLGDGSQQQSVDLVKYFLSAKANVTHLASLQMSKGPGGSDSNILPGTRIQETVVCDHRFVYAVQLPNTTTSSGSTSLPVLLGVYHLQN
jgi:hypothetical protein